MTSSYFNQTNQPGVEVEPIPSSFQGLYLGDLTSEIPHTNRFVASSESLNLPNSFQGLYLDGLVKEETTKYDNQFLASSETVHMPSSFQGLYLGGLSKEDGNNDNNGFASRHANPFLASSESIGKNVMPSSFQGVYLGELTNKLKTPVFDPSISVEQFSDEANKVNNNVVVSSNVDGVNENVLGSKSHYDSPLMSITDQSKSFALSSLPLTTRSAVASSHSHATTSSATTLLNDLEAAILRSNEPIQIDETDEIEVNGNRGLWANKNEAMNWKGSVPITRYPINQDPNPEIIIKQSHQNIEYIQELAIRYLKPPTPEPPGDIIINQLPNQPTSPAPPLIIRQQPPRPETPQPLVIREVPPPPPAQVGRKIVTISGKQLPPPPRKVVIERLAPLPSKPQAVLVERWLPYSNVKRKVIFNKAASDNSVVVKPRNVIVQWDAPKVTVRKNVRYLGVIRANPAEYVQRYGQNSLRPSHQLPQFVTDIKTPEGIVLASDVNKLSTDAATQTTVHELYGDVEALKLVDLEREGLSEYRAQLNRAYNSEFAPNSLSPIAKFSPIIKTSNNTSLNHSHASSSDQPFHGFDSDANDSYYQTLETSVASVYTGTRKQLNESELIEETFRAIDLDEHRRLSVEEAEKAVSKVNSRLGKGFSDDDVKMFFSTLDVSMDGTIDFDEFKSAFHRVVS